MITAEQFLKELESVFKTLADKLKEEFGNIRGTRPSIDMLEGIKVSIYEQMLPINQLGNLSIQPPRTIQITVWDKNAVGAVMKAIEGSHLGLSARNDGNNIFATLSPLGNERREELMKLVKKTSEEIRIQLRNRRDDIMKRIKEAEAKKELTEDAVFKAKEKIQKLVDDTNGKIEAMVEGKLKELGE